MKKIGVIVVALFLCIALFTGCGGNGTNKPSDAPGEVNTVELSTIQNEIQEHDCMVGVAFLAYPGTDTSLADRYNLLNSCPTAGKYPFLQNRQISGKEGSELYAIVTLDKATTITAYEAGINENGELAVNHDKIIAKSDEDGVLILFCNPSEIYSNVSISVKKDEMVLEFSPMLSGENGKLVKIDGVYDFSVYDDMGVDNPVMNAYGILLEAPEIKGSMDNQGMGLIYTGDTETIDEHECYIFALGTEHEDQFVREQYYAVYDTQIYVYDAEKDDWSTLT